MTIPRRRHQVWRQPLCAFLLSCALIASAGAVQAAITPPSVPAVLTLDEAARLLRIGSDELERLALGNEVPSRRIGSRWRFNRAALMAWLNGDWKLITTAVPRDAAPLASRAMGRITGTGASVAQRETPPSPVKKTPANGEDPSNAPILNCDHRRI